MGFGIFENLSTILKHNFKDPEAEVKYVIRKFI